MKGNAATVFLGTGVLLLLTLHGPSSETPAAQPLSLALECAAKDCTLLQGSPQTAGMRSGLVRLKPGESVGWHTTEKNEEELVILKGQGEALIEGQSPKAFVAPRLVYIPPHTRHNVVNTAGQLLEYVYVVAPAKAR